MEGHREHGRTRAAAAPDRRRAAPVRLVGWSALALLVAAAAWGGGATRPAQARLQETGAPVAATCDVPPRAAPPAPATPGAEGTPAVAATPAATPTAEQLAAVEVEAVARALAACLTEGDNRTVARLTTDAYLGQVFGGGPPLTEEDFLALAESLPVVPTQIRAFGEVEVEGDEVSAGVVSVVGNQLLRARWRFVADPNARARDTRWRVDGEEPLPVEPPAGATALGVAMEEYEFGLDEEEAVGPDVVLEGRNGGAEDHEMLVLRLDRGATTADLLRAPGPELPRGVTIIGQAIVPADDRADLVLVDLDPGTYTIVCLLPAANGTPHLAYGMEAEFEVR